MALAFRSSNNNNDVCNQSSNNECNFRLITLKKIHQSLTMQEYKIDKKWYVSRIKRPPIWENSDEDDTDC
jgi:hypothetical protein